MPRINFIIEDQKNISHKMQITIQASESPQDISIIGLCRDIVHAALGGILYGKPYRLDSLSIDGEQNPQGDKNKMFSLFDKIQKGMQDQTVEASLEGKNLKIFTRQ